MTEEQKKILALQQPSTARKLRIEWGCATPEDLAWKPNEETRAIPDAQSMDEAVNPRYLGLEEAEQYLEWRRARGKHIEAMHQANFTKAMEARVKIPEHIANTHKSSIPAENRERATQAFMSPKSFMKSMSEKFYDFMRSAGLWSENPRERLQRIKEEAAKEIEHL